jgi:hypothetical protein
MTSPPQEGIQNKRLAALGALAVVLLVAAGGALIYGIVVDPAVAGPIAGAVGVIVAAIVQRVWEKNQELERLRREQMAPIYEQLISTLKENPGEAVVAEFFKDLTTKLVLYGPASIIKEWNEFRLHGVSADDPTDPTSLLNYEKLLLLVRKDLGHDDSDLELGDLLRVYVNDFDEMYNRWLAKQSHQTEIQPSQ